MADQDPPATRIVVHIAVPTGERRASRSKVDQLPFDAAIPFRQRHDRRGQPNVSGHYFFATSAKHVPHESVLEKYCLIELDRDAAVSDVLAQPFSLTWRRGARREGHIPDFVVQLELGWRRVIDVRATNHASHSDFTGRVEVTRRICRRLGWQYVVYEGPTPQVQRNLRVLALHRHRQAPPDLVPKAGESPRRGRALAPFSPALRRARDRTRRDPPSDLVRRSCLRPLPAAF